MIVRCLGVVIAVSFPQFRGEWGSKEACSSWRSAGRLLRGLERVLVRQLLPVRVRGRLPFLLMLVPILLGIVERAVVEQEQTAILDLEVRRIDFDLGALRAHRA